MEKGDLVTTYHKGIYKITEIIKRFYENERSIPSFLKDTKKIGDEYNSMVTYVKVLQENGDIPKRNKINSCDISYCKPVDIFIKEKEQELLKLKENLKLV